MQIYFILYLKRLKWAGEVVLFAEPKLFLSWCFKDTDEEDMV